MASKKKGDAKLLKAGQNEPQTAMKRTLPSQKTKSSDYAFSQETVIGRKRKLLSGTGEPPSKIIRNSKETKCKTKTLSQSRSKRKAARKGHAKAVNNKGKESGLKSESTPPINKRNSKSQPKSKLSSRKYTPGKIDRSLKKSSNKKRTCKNTASKKKTFKRNKRDTLAKHGKIVPSFLNEPVFRIIRVIKTDLKELVSTICCVNKQTMWIGRQAFDSLMKVEYKENGTLTILKDFPLIDFYDFCFDREDSRILYCDRQNNCIMSISSNFEIKEWKSVRPLCPTCITISPDGWIFVGLAHDYAYYAAEPEVRQIIKMDKFGTIFQRINSLQNGGPIFQRIGSRHKRSSGFIFSHRCTMNPVNNDLVVVGYITQYKGLLCNFNTKGLIGFTYFGNGSSAQFSPRALTCSSQGNILVSNKTNGDIHILNKNGKCLYVLGMKFSGLREIPWSFSWDLTGHLLIGTLSCRTGNIIICEYSDPNGDDKNALV